MEKEEFSRIRNRLGMTQSQMARLLGTSIKAVQSFEQGWRNVAVHVERQMLFLLAAQRPSGKKNKTCWTSLQCPLEVRRNCPAWEFQLGHLCWFVNGTICHGEVQQDWAEKIKICRSCKVFRSQLS